MKNKWAQSEQAFGLLFAAVFLILYVHSFVKSDQSQIWKLIVAIALFVISILAPQTLKQLKIVWLKFGHVLGFITTPVVMGLLFFFFITGTSILIKMFRVKFMPIKWDPDIKSYWIRREEVTERSSFKFQF